MRLPERADPPQCFWTRLLGLVLGAWGAFASSSGEPPNLVVIVADDLGFSDLGCYGGEIETPNLDALARHGLRFTQFYNTARCWPSRAALLTGYYAQQVRRDTVPGVVNGSQGIRPPWARLLPERLRPLGYRSYHSGKWHVDGPRLAGGFDRSYSVEDHDRFFGPRQHLEDDRPLPPPPAGSGYYATTAIADYAIRFLTEHAAGHPKRPFLLYLAFTAPHFPLQALPEDIARYRDRYQPGWDVIREQRWQRLRALGIVNCALAPREDTVPSWNLSAEELQRQVGPGEVARAVAWAALTPAQQEFQATKMAIHAAMVDRMDREIGRVLAQVRAMNAWTNTLILFLSDNGASAEQIIRGDGHDPGAAAGSARTFLGLGPGWSSAANTPFRLHKSWVHEGGISTPFIVHWPGGLRAQGEWRTTPAHLVDLVPTLLEVAGASLPSTGEGQPVPPWPGRSLRAVWERSGEIRRDFLWWQHEGHRAIRVGDWKLVSLEPDGPWELYDLGADRCERRNLATIQPERVHELETKWTEAWEAFRALAGRDLAQPGVAPPARR